MGKTCGEGEIVYINTVTHDWMCGIDDGRCPGAFQVGCEPDPNYSTAVPPPPPVNFCNQTKNPLGDCECGDQNQLRINHDCSLATMCFANGTHAEKTCGEGEIVYINTATHDWMCGIDDG